jgi:hypothetical protein
MESNIYQAGTISGEFLVILLVVVVVSLLIKIAINTGKKNK